MSLGEQVRAARGRTGLRELARDIGISPSYLSDIEADRRRPSEETWAALSEAIPVRRSALAEEIAATWERRHPRIVAALPRVRALEDDLRRRHRGCGYCGDNLDGSVVQCETAVLLGDHAREAPGGRGVTPGYKACRGPRCLTEIPSDRDLCFFCARTYERMTEEEVERNIEENLRRLDELNPSLAQRLGYAGDGRSHRRGERAA